MEASTNNFSIQEASTGIVVSKTSESARGRAASLLDKVTFFALLTIVPLSAIPYGTVEQWWKAAFECAVLILTVMWVIEGFLSRAWHIDEHRQLLLPLFALVGFAYLQTLSVWDIGTVKSVGGEVRRAISADPYETRLFVLNLIALILAGALLLRYTSNRRRLRMLVYVVAGTGTLNALFGIVRRLIQSDVWRIGLQVKGRSVLSLYLDPGTGYGQFINRNHFAFLMEMTFGLLLGLIVGQGVRRRKQLLIYLAAATPVWTALVLTTSRGGVFSMLGQVVFIAVLFIVVKPWQKTTEMRSRNSGAARRRSRRIGKSLVVRATLIACLVAVAIVGVVWVGGDPLVSRLEDMPRQFSTGGAEARTGARRVEIWRATWEMIKDHPLAGVGFGGYWALIPQYHDASGRWTPQQAHNDYLELLASGGVIGAALGAWFIVVFIKRARERLRSRSTDRFQYAARLGALTGLFGVALHSLVDFGLHITVNALIFVALAVVVTVGSRAQRTPPGDELHRRYAS